MEKRSLTQTCFEMLSKEVALERIPGFEDLEHLKLVNGEDGDSVRLYRGNKIEKVTLVEFMFGREGIPVPHKGSIQLGSELFQIIPDFSCKLPIWGINWGILEDGTYDFDTDFFFGFDLVSDYEFTMKYLDSFNVVYKKFQNHPDFVRVHLDAMTTWARTYISPIFIIARTKAERVGTVFEVCAEFIKLWVRMWREAERKDDTFRQAQQKRIQSWYAGSRASDRIGMMLRKIYGEETFSKFFKAIS